MLNPEIQLNSADHLSLLIRFPSSLFSKQRHGPFCPKGPGQLLTRSIAGSGSSLTLSSAVKAPLATPSTLPLKSFGIQHGQPSFQLLFCPKLAVNYLGLQPGSKDEVRRGRESRNGCQQPPVSPTRSTVIENNGLLQGQGLHPSPETSSGDQRGHLLSGVQVYLGDLRDAGQLAQSSQGDPLMHCFQFGPKCGQG